MTLPTLPMLPRPYLEINDFLELNIIYITFQNSIYVIYLIYQIANTQMYTDIDWWLLKLLTNMAS